MLRHGSLGSALEILTIYGVVVVLIVLGRFVSPHFLTFDNFLTVLNGIALLGIVASGMAFVTYSGNMADLSVPSIIAFSGIISVAALPFGLPAALIAGILAGLAIGAMNGFVVGRLNANPILWTLAVAFFMEGFMRFTWSNNQVYPDIEPGTPGAAFIGIFRLQAEPVLFIVAMMLLALAVGQLVASFIDVPRMVLNFTLAAFAALAALVAWVFLLLAGPVPLIVVVMLLALALAQFVMTLTRFGRESRLVGASRPTARASGIDVPRVVFLNFLVASFAASIAGVFITSMNKLGVFYLGQGYDFKAVTAVVIGGVTLGGGRGNMIGVLGGVLVIGFLTNVMTFMGITSFRQDIITGAVFIAVVALQYRHSRGGGDG